MESGRMIFGLMQGILCGETRTVCCGSYIRSQCEILPEVLPSTSSCNLGSEKIFPIFDSKKRHWKS